MWGATPLVVIALVPLVLLRWRINVLSLGDEEAKALGVEAGLVRLVVIAAATLMTASVVADFGRDWLGGPHHSPHRPHAGWPKLRSTIAGRHAARGRLLRCW